MSITEQSIDKSACVHYRSTSLSAQNIQSSLFFREQCNIAWQYPRSQTQPLEYKSNAKVVESNTPSQDSAPILDALQPNLVQVYRE